ncbi:hypothetical protein CVT26_001001 [Gymnopilus dilepis]|uniref:Uncharacterized protein n=1 Tax=Gymnopilus dilepis TaxID=231916 RepID=A0A409WVW0_9AGAR|nr:hypothetical protein CVT26_001001 [Gymnopilus dilepis]
MSPSWEVAHSWFAYYEQEVVDFAFSLYRVEDLLNQYHTSPALFEALRQKTVDSYPVFTLCIMPGYASMPIYTRVSLDTDTAYVISANEVEHRRPTPSAGSKDSKIIITVGFRLYSYLQSTFPLSGLLDLEVDVEHFIRSIPSSKPLRCLKDLKRHMRLVALYNSVLL